MGENNYSSQEYSLNSYRYEYYASEDIFTPPGGRYLAERHERLVKIDLKRRLKLLENSWRVVAIITQATNIKFSCQLTTVSLNSGILKDVVFKADIV